jgi:iron complex outermembrane recepter protein
MKTSKLLLLTLVFLNSFAQKKDSIKTSKATEIKEVTVEGGSSRKKYVVKSVSNSLRVPAPLIEIPQNISVATSQTIRDFGINGTADLARLTSGITKTYGTNNDFSFSIRGTDATNNIFRNGIGGGYWWNIQSDAFMIDRVEFVKGPAGFMIGNAEPGGLVNEVTKAADGKRHFEYHSGAGSYGLIRNGLDFGNTFSKDSKFSYRVVFGNQYSNSYYDFYEAKRFYFLPSIKYSYGENSSIDLQYVRMDGRSKNDGYSNISFDGKKFELPVNFNSVDQNLVPDGIETDDNYWKLTHQHKFNDNLKITTQGAMVNGLYAGQSMYVSNFATDLSTIYRNYFETNWRNRLNTVQTFLDYTFFTGKKLKHSFLTGVDYASNSIKTTFAEPEFPDFINNLPLSVSNPQYGLTRASLPNLVWGPEERSGTVSKSVYFQDHIKFKELFIVTLAGRLSNTRAYSSVDENIVRNTKFTPRFGFTYLISKNMSAYALYDQSFLPQTGRKEDQTSAKPLTGDNIELGYKAEVNDRFAINASLYKTVKNNVLVQNPLSSLYVERGQITSKGFEISTIGSITDQLNINFNYTYTDAKITKDIDETMVGFANYGVAKNVTNIMVRYKLIHKKDLDLALGHGLQYMGDRSSVWAGWTAVEDKAKTLPDYMIFDWNLSLDYKKLSLQLNLYNATNEQYVDSGIWNSADTDNNFPGYYSGQLGLPRNYRVSLNYRF